MFSNPTIAFIGGGDRNKFGCIQHLQSGRDSTQLLFQIKKTGRETAIGEYNLADKAYYTLLMKLKKNKFETTDPELKKMINLYYSNHDESHMHNIHANKVRKITRALVQLNAT